MLGITCTSILVVSVFGAVAADPHRKHLPIQVRHTAGLKSQSPIVQDAGLRTEVHQKLSSATVEVCNLCILIAQSLLMWMGHPFLCEGYTHPDREVTVMPQGVMLYIVRPALY